MNSFWKAVIRCASGKPKNKKLHYIFRNAKKIYNPKNYFLHFSCDCRENINMHFEDKILDQVRFGGFHTNCASLLSYLNVVPDSRKNSVEIKP